MKTCNSCRFDNPEDSSKCNKCGVKIDKMDRDFVWRWFCPQCSGKNMGGNYTCFNCGFKRQKESGSNCFLTTTVCDILGKDDNCLTLSKMRAFRQNNLETNTDGRLLLKEYKEISSHIVPKILEDMNKVNLCRFLEQNYINPIIELIDSNQTESAISGYKCMVEFLLHKYKQPSP